MIEWFASAAPSALPPGGARSRIRGCRWVVRHLLAAGTLAVGLAGPAVHAAALTIGVVSRANDDRLDRTRVEFGYLGQPGGTPADAVEMALKEASFQLDAAKLEVKVETEEASDAASALAALQKLEQAGAAAAIVDLPAAWLAPNLGKLKLTVVNAGEAADSLRALCAPNLFHTLPSERMRTDALAQALTARKWTRVLLLHGPSAEDQTRRAVVEASLKRYGLLSLIHI